MKTVIEMAREAGWDDHHAEFDTRLKRFAELVRADAIAEEREACAKVCDEADDPFNDPYENALARELSAAIRARR